jgi:hypothetical protein
MRGVLGVSLYGIASLLVVPDITLILCGKGRDGASRPKGALTMSWCPGRRDFASPLVAVKYFLAGAGNLEPIGKQT